MIELKEFGAELQKLQFDFFCGVPCSLLKNLINYAINECEYVAAVNEGDAVAIAAGAYIGGRKPIVLMQNSGLTNAVSPLVSLNHPFQIPLLGFVSLRGEMGEQDEPQHELIGQITTRLLELMNVKWDYLSSEITEAKEQLHYAQQVIEENQPYYFVVRKGTFSAEKLKNNVIASRVNVVKKRNNAVDRNPTRYEVLSVINALRDNHTVQIAATGKTGRELYEIEDSPNNLYMVGSMGCVSSLGLGLALTQKNKHIVAIDGDGGLLMRMGSLATNAYYSPSNLLHILLDNNAHDSTGGQSTVSHIVDFVEVAASCGYTNAIYIHNLEELKKALLQWKATQGLTFLYLKISKGSQQHLGRPNIKPHEVKERLLHFISSHSNCDDAKNGNKI